MGTSRLQLFLDGFPCRVGDRTGGIVGLDLIIRQRIDQILLPQILEEILLPPALEHAMSHDDDAQVPAAGEDRRLMAVAGQASHLTQPQFPFCRVRTM